MILTARFMRGKAARGLASAASLLAGLATGAACSASGSDAGGGASIERGQGASAGTSSASVTGTTGSASSTTGSQLPGEGLVDIPMGDPDAEDPNCGEQHFMQQASPAEVLLVLDRSASMQDPPSDDVSTSKWDLTVPALNQVVESTNTLVHWGLKTFPESQDTDACSPETISNGIHIPIAENNAATVVQAINATTDEGDGTPTG